MPPLPVIVVRPEPGNAATVTAAHAMGLPVSGHPLFAALPVEWSCPDPANFDGLIIGSANVFRLAGPAMQRLKTLPVHVVGATTAQEAERSGFRVATTGAGGLQPVLDTLGGQRLLRLAGAEHIPLAPPDGTTVTTRIVYEIQPQAMPSELLAILKTGAIVLLHSGEAARHFARQCDAAMIERGSISLACLAPRIAESAGDGWRAVKIAEEPTDRALLALAAQMCQNMVRSRSG